MLRKTVLVLAISAGLVFASSGTALAWDSIAQKSGHGRVTLRAWTKNYNQVAFVANHKGTRVHVALTIDCRDGYHYDNTWNDGGTTFRLVRYGLGNHGRCNHTFQVVPNSSFPLISLWVYARG
jgi:hypothetical protein